MLIQKLSVLTVLTKLTCDSVKCAPFLFYFALLPDLNKWIWRQTTLTTHPYQRDAEKIPTNQKLKTGGKLST